MSSYLDVCLIFGYGGARLVLACLDAERKLEDTKYEVQK